MIFRVAEPVSASDVVARMRAREILISTVGPDAIRLVTHHDVGRANCIAAAEALAEEIEAAMTARA